MICTLAPNSTKYQNLSLEIAVMKLHFLSDFEKQRKQKQKQKQKKTKQNKQNNNNNKNNNKKPYCTERKNRMAMIQVFKIVQNINDISMDGLFEFSDTQTRGNSKKLLKPRAFKTFRMNSFCVRSINNWNALSDHIVNSNTVQQFKTLYDRHMGFSKSITETIY